MRCPQVPEFIDFNMGVAHLFEPSMLGCGETWWNHGILSISSPHVWRSWRWYQGLTHWRTAQVSPKTQRPARKTMRVEGRAFFEHLLVEQKWLKRFVKNVYRRYVWKNMVFRCILSHHVSSVYPNFSGLSILSWIFHIFPILPILVIYQNSIFHIFPSVPLEGQFLMAIARSHPTACRMPSATWDGPASSSESSGDEDPMQAEGSHLAGRWPPWPPGLPGLVLFLDPKWSQSCRDVA